MEFGFILTYFNSNQCQIIQFMPNLHSGYNTLCYCLQLLNNYYDEHRRKI